MSETESFDPDFDFLENDIGLSFHISDDAFPKLNITDVQNNILVWNALYTADDA